MTLHKHQEINQTRKLLGIDIFRSIAAYGVVLIHGLGEIPRDSNSLIITNFFTAFSVPFFLITSFYFSRKAILLNDTKKYLNNRIQRIIIPYFVWTIIYLLARSIQYLIGNKESFNRLIFDPINIIFFGAAGVQLYFIPMLFCGILVAIIITKFFKPIKSNLLAYICFLLSIWLFDLIVKTGNDFILGQGIAFKHLINISIFNNFGIFQNFLRVILVALAWIIRCMPYIIFSIIIHDFQDKKLLSKYINFERIRKYRWITLVLIPLFIVAGFLCNLYLINLFIPYILFIYAMVISDLITPISLISLVVNGLGRFSFGIYLIHALLTAGFLPIVIKLYPQIMTYHLSSVMLIISSGVIFLISLTITYLISLNKTASRILLGI